MSRDEVMTITLELLDGFYGVAQLPPEAAVPDWVSGAGFWAIMSARDETTIVCPQHRLPADVTASRDWACLRTIGPFEFDQPGIVRDLITPISDAGIGVFVVCTYDGEHILVPANDMPRVRRLLEGSGFVFDS